MNEIVKRIDAEIGAADPLSTVWACLMCWWKGRIGKMRVAGDAPLASALRCPSCGSDNVHPADGTVRDLPAYYGPIGTKH